MGQQAWRSVTACSAAVILAAGCGGITRTKVGEPAPGVHRYSTRSGRKIAVVVGTVTSMAEIEADMKDAVSRYLRDQAAAALAQHDLYQVVDKGTTGTDLLTQFMQTDAKETRAVATDGVLEVEILALEEKLGATVKVGFASSQRKFAKATLALSLRMANGRDAYRAIHTGKSSKGAWGVVAMVDRRQMRKREGIWNLDGSMAGQACAKALQAGVRDVTTQLNRDIHRLAPGDVDRWLRPGSGPAR